MDPTSDRYNHLLFDKERKKIHTGEKTISLTNAVAQTGWLRVKESKISILITLYKNATTSGLKTSA